MSTTHPVPQIHGYTFTPEGLLGEGAYGRVWAARYKGDILRAVKVFKRGSLHESVWRAEFDKLKALDEPPGIVTLYDRGHTDDGLPYFSMRLMADQAPSGVYQGRTLRKLIEHPAESDADPWKLLLGIAETLSYLHEKGVYHCDVKPENVLLSGGGDARPVLCDFGQSHEKGEGVAYGTLYYACPGQLRRPDEISETWDVYSFGVLAYELLTGRLPRLEEHRAMARKERIAGSGFERTFDQTLVAAEQTFTGVHAKASIRDQFEEVVQIIEATPKVSFPKNYDSVRAAELGVIENCLLAPASGGRGYQNMHEVLQAFHSCQEDRIVARERRKKSIYAVLSLLALLAAGIAGWQWRSAGIAQRETEKSRLNEEQAKFSAEASAGEARVQRDGALLSGKQTLLAKRSAEQLINSMLYDLNENLEEIGRVDLLDQVSRDAEAYFNNLIEKDPASERERSTLLNNRGDVYFAKAEYINARISYEKSYAIRKSLLLADPGNDLCQRDVFVSLDRIGDAQFALGHIEKAQKIYLESYHVRKGVFKKSGTMEARHDLAIVLEKLGDVSLSKGEGKSALGYFSESLALRQKLSPTEKTTATRLQEELAGTHLKLGDAAFFLDDTQKASRYYQSSIEMCLALLEEVPNHHPRQRKLALARLRLSDLLATGQALDEAGTLNAQALASLTRLVDFDPLNKGLAENLDAALDKAVALALLQGEADRALAFAKKRFLLVANHAEEARDMAKYRGIRIQLADALVAAKQLTKAKDLYAEVFMEITKSHPSPDPRTALTLSILEYNMGDILRSQDQQELAVKRISSALARLRKYETHKAFSEEAREWVKLMQSELELNP